MNTKRILFLLRRPPSDRPIPVEALQSAVVAAIFEQRVSLLIRDDGVLLLAPPTPDDSDQLLISTLESLQEYGITDVFVCRKSMNRLGVNDDALVIPATPIDGPAQAALIAAQDAVVSD